RARIEADPPSSLPRRGVGAGIIDRHFVSNGVEVRAGKGFDGVKSVGVRHAFQIRNPHSFVVSDGIDNKRIAFEMPDAVSVVTGSEILWMTTAVQVNGAEAMRSTGLKDDELLQFRK